MTNMWHTKSNAILYHRVSLTAMKFYPYHRKHRWHTKSNAILYN